MKNWNLLGLLGFYTLIMSIFSAQVAYAGSGGAIGGNDSGSNLDSSTVTGATFEPTDAIIILEPLVNGIIVDPQSNQILVAPVLESDLAVLTRQFNADIEGQWVEGLLRNSPATFRCLSTPNNMDSCSTESVTVELAEKLKSTLGLDQDSQQAQLVDQLVITLQGSSEAEEIDPTQLDRGIKLYNKLINSLNQEQLTTLSEMTEMQEIKSSLQKMRDVFDVHEETKNPQ